MACHATSVCQCGKACQGCWAAPIRWIGIRRGIRGSADRAERPDDRREKRNQTLSVRSELGWIFFLSHLRLLSARSWLRTWPGPFPRAAHANCPIHSSGSTQKTSEGEVAPHRVCTCRYRFCIFRMRHASWMVAMAAASEALTVALCWPYHDSPASDGRSETNSSSLPNSEGSVGSIFD